MQGGKRSRKRKRRDKGKEKEMVPTAGSTGAQEALNAGEKSPQQHREAPNRSRDVTEYRGTQLCRLCTLDCEVDVSMEEAVHFLFLAIVTVHVQASASSRCN